MVSNCQEQFSDLTKEQEGQIGKEKMSRMNVKEKLSERAVVKERGLGECFSREKKDTIGT